MKKYLQKALVFAGLVTAIAANSLHAAADTTDYVTAYADAIEEARIREASYGGDNYSWATYTLCDMDADGIKELIVFQMTSKHEAYNYVYTVSGDGCKFLGEYISDTGIQDLCGYNDGFMFRDYYKGWVALYWEHYNGDDFDLETLYEGSYDRAGNPPTLSELGDYYDASVICDYATEFVSLDDMSLLAAAGDGGVTTGSSSVADDSTLHVGDLAAVDYCDEYISLREYSYSGANVLTTIPLGETVVYIGRDEEYAHVAYRDMDGYVLERYLRHAGRDEGEEVDLSAEERKAINQFISIFNIALFPSPHSYFDLKNNDGSSMIDFAYNYLRKTDPQSVESRFRNDAVSTEEWGEETDRISLEQVEAVTKKFFDSVPERYDGPYITYRDGYFYWLETGGNTLGSHSVLTSAYDLGNGDYKVLFRGADNDWTDDECGMTAEEAEAQYGLGRITGIAYIHSDAGLKDTEQFHMTKYVRSLIQ